MPPETPTTLTLNAGMYKQLRFMLKMAREQAAEAQSAANTALNAAASANHTMTKIQEMLDYIASEAGTLS